MEIAVLIDPTESHLKCTICAKKNKKTEAVKYCVECKSYCCQDCVEAHETFPVLNGHTLLDNNATTSPLHVARQHKPLPMLPTERCSKHPSYIVDMYCGDHDIVGCSTCMTMDHRSCEQLHSIPDEIDNLYKITDLNLTKRDVKGSKKLLSELVSKKADMLLNLMTSKSTTKESIKTFKKKLKDEMETVLDKLEENAIKQVDHIYNSTEETILADKADLEGHLSKVNGINDKIQDAAGNRAQEFVWMKFAQANILELASMDSTLKHDKDVAIAFDPHPGTSTIFNHFKSFGDIYIKELDEATRNTTYAVKGKYDINLKLSDDITSCCFEGTCVTPDGFLLVTDYNNNVIKRVDIESSTFVDHCAVHSFPAGICHVKDKQVAVACVGNRTIQFVGLGKEMTIDRHFTVAHSCFGIASTGEKLFVTDYGQSVFVYDMKGFVLNRISKDALGNSFFRNPRHIALSGKGNKIFVCNCDKSKGVTILDTDGKYKASFTHPEMPMAYGVHGDGDKNMFVCGQRTSNVMLLSIDGKSDGVILSSLDELKAPQSICFQTDSNKLFVTERENNNVKVYILERVEDTSHMQAKT